MGKLNREAGQSFSHHRVGLVHAQFKCRAQVQVGSCLISHGFSQVLRSSYAFTGLILQLLHPIDCSGRRMHRAAAGSKSRGSVFLHGQRFIAPFTQYHASPISHPGCMLYSPGDFYTVAMRGFESKLFPSQPVELMP